MTVSRPPESPLSRRAARLMRDEAARRAPEEGAAPPVEDPASTPSEADAPPDARRRSAPHAEHSARRAARGAGLLEAAPAGALPARHARPGRARRFAVVAGLAVGAALLLGSSAAVTAMMVPPPDPASATMRLKSEPSTVEQLPVPTLEQTPVVTDLCTVPEFIAALEARDDEAAIVAAGGGEAFRAAVAAGRASCVDLADPARRWAVVNKLRPANPVDYRPTGLIMPDGVRNIEGGALRSDAASALTALVAAARDAGVGEVALESGFRSYQTQQSTYGRHYAERGAQADQVSARPGYSEHQTGLGADVVACSGACGALDDLAATPQGQWIADHSWEQGWIVRYVDGATPVTGYLPEPWHLRYVGPELARAYHDGGWQTLEEFFGLEAAPDYRD
ncbi:D-alanyl-D-alanine carboxypeptidase family protein [Microbacterium allomyrinae]|nr:D-alanyl-D-alanine carboxypeptidase family protein [Microbacterium allomyrinae]